jgi:hypothetical protein
VSGDLAARGSRAASERRERAWEAQRGWVTRRENSAGGRILGELDVNLGMVSVRETDQTGDPALNRVPQEHPPADYCM